MKKGIALLLVLVLAALLAACDDGLKIIPLESNGYFLAVKNDGTVLATDRYPEEIKLWTDIVEVGDALEFVAGLKKDGTVVLTGYYANYYHRNKDEPLVYNAPPEEIANAVEGWTDIVEIATAKRRITGLKKDGTVVFAAKKNSWEEKNFQGVTDWTDIVAIADFDEGPIVGVKKDGTVVVAAWEKYDKYSNLSSWTDIVAVSVGEAYIVGLKKNGTVVAEGYNEYGQCNVTGWTDITAIAAGEGITAGLKKDGTVVAVGKNEYGCLDVGDWKDIVAISTEYLNIIGVKRDGSVISVGRRDDPIGEWNLND